MDIFRCEEQGGKTYLLYEKKDEDILDTFTMEMLSNNKIEGIVPFSYIQKNHEIQMKYNVTGLMSLREILTEKVKRKDLLIILKSLANAVLRADDYMLETSSYVFDESYIYINPVNKKVSMIVLPVERQGKQPEMFLRQLLFDVDYDQTEDCSYVTVLMRFFRNEKSFSMQQFREQIVQLQKREVIPEQKVIEKPEPVVLKKEQNVNEIYNPSTEADKNGHDLKKTLAGKQVKKPIGHDSEDKRKNMDIIFHDQTEEKPQEKKRRFFWEKDKGEKKSLFGKKADKKTDEMPAGNIKKSPLDGLRIPGMDLAGKLKEEKENVTDAESWNVQNNRKVSIPAQEVELERRENPAQDFGKTETVTQYIDPDETLLLGQEPEQHIVTERPELSHPLQRFFLYRCRTEESFEIKGDIVRVGRSSSISEICIPGNRGIGRIHVVLYVQDGQVFIADNGSKNGTFVDGEELKPEDPPRLLLSGSKIRMSDEEFEFRISR